MATLSFCASLTTTLSHNQTPTLSSYSSSSKTNLRFLSLTHTLSSHSLISSFSSSPRASKLSFVPKFSETEPSILEAPILEAEPQPESEPSQVVEASTEEPSQVVEATTEEPKREEVFAVVMIGSRQYIVFPGRFIYTQRFKGANVNDKVILNKVLLVGTRTSTYIGQPVVPNAAVHAVVEEQGLNKKVTVFKYKKKKGYRRNIGHRQPNTRIRIMGITGYENSTAVTLP